MPFRLRALTAPASLPAPQLRQLISVMAFVRWAGLSWLGILGLVTPPRHPALLVPLILGVAAYSAWALWAAATVPDAMVPRVARAVTGLDILTYFVYLAIFIDTHAFAYNVYTFVLIEAIATDAIPAAVFAVGVFVTGFAVFEGAANLLFHRPFMTADLVVWSLIILFAAGILAAVDRILLAAGRSPARAAARDTPPLPLSEGEGKMRSVHLSTREQEVLRLVAQGYSNAMIAATLHLSETTVKTYVQNLLTRLSARNRAEAVAAGSRLNLL